MVSCEIYIDAGSYDIVKTISAETRDDLEARVEEVVKVCSYHGFFDDDLDSEWLFIPSHQINSVRIKFTEEEDEQREN